MANMAVNRDWLTAGFARFQPARYLYVMQHVANNYQPPEKRQIIAAFSKARLPSKAQNHTNPSMA